MQEDGRFLGSGLVVLPRDVAPTDVALPVGPHGEEKALAEAHGGVDQPVACDRTAGGGVGADRFHPPEFLAGHGVVSVERHRARADQDVLPIDLHDERSGVGLAHVSVALRLPVGIEVLVVNTALRFPNRIAGLLVHRDHELVIGPIEVDDEKILVDDGRRARAAEMVADKVPAFPDDFPGIRFEAGGVGGAEGEVDQSVFQHRGGGGIGIEGVAKLRVLHNAEFLVVELVAVLLVEAHQRETGPLRIRVGHPDAIAPHHRRRPCPAFEGGLPGNVLLFAPFGGQVPGFCMSLCPRTAKARPVLGCQGAQSGEKRERECESGESDSHGHATILVRP